MSKSIGPVGSGPEKHGRPFVLLIVVLILAISGATALAAEPQETVFSYPQLNSVDVDVDLVKHSGMTVRILTDSCKVILSPQLLASLSAKGYKEVTIRIWGNWHVEITAKGEAVNYNNANAPLQISLPVPADRDAEGYTAQHTDGGNTVLPFSYPENGWLTFFSPTDGSFAVSYNAKSFNDLPDDWYRPAIAFVSARELFNGVDAYSFAPGMSMTRSMFATVLYRLDSSPGIQTSVRFSDIASGLWYSDPVTWAASNGIVRGVGDNKYNPGQNVTREQMVQILYNYAIVKGLDTDANIELSGFADAQTVNGWALSAMKWAVEGVLIAGRPDGRLDPAGQATRAEVAIILQRFVEGTGR